MIDNWTIHTPEAIFGPFKTAGEAGEWLVNNLEELVMPAHIEPLISPHCPDCKATERRDSIALVKPS